MLKRRRDTFTDQSRKRPHLSGDSSPAPVHNFALTRPNPQDLESYAQFARGLACSRRPPTAADQACIADSLLLIHAYLFDPKKAEESKKWVEGKLQEKNVFEVIYLLRNTGRLLDMGMESKSNSNSFSDKFKSTEYKPSAEFLKWVLEKIAIEIDSPNQGGLQTLRIVEIGKILFNIVSFVDKNFILAGTLKEFDGNIIKLVEVAHVGSYGAQPKEFVNFFLNLKCLAEEKILKNPIKIETIDLLLKGFILKKEQASLRQIATLIHTLGVSFKKKYLICEEHNKDMLPDIGALWDHFMERAREAASSGVVVVGNGIQPCDIAFITCGLTNLAEESLLIGRVNIEDVVFLLGLLLYYRQQATILHINNTVSAVGRLSKEKRLSTTPSSHTIPVRYINGLLALVFEKGDEVTTFDISNILYWLGELAKNKHLKGLVELDRIKPLLDKFVKNLDISYEPPVSNMIYGLAEMAKKDCIKPLIEKDYIKLFIDVQQINLLLKKMANQLLYGRGEIGLKAHAIEIKNTINGLVLLLRKQDLRGGIDPLVFDPLLKVVQEGGECIDSEDIAYLKQAEILKHDVENLTPMPLQTTVIPVGSHENVLRSLRERDIFTLSVSEMYDPFASEMYDPFVSEMYDPFAQQEELPVDGKTESTAAEAIQTAIEIDDNVLGFSTHFCESIQRSEMEESIQIAEQREMDRVAEARLENERQINESSNPEEIEMSGDSEDEIDFLRTVKYIPDEDTDIEEIIGEESEVEEEQIEEVDGEIEEEEQIEDVDGEIEEEEQVEEEEQIEEEEMAVTGQPEEADTLGTIRWYIDQEDIAGLNNYLNLPGHHCTENILPKNGIDYPRPEKRATVPRANPYNEIIKTFFEAYCNKQLVKKTRHQYFISLLKAISREWRDQLASKDALKPLILHLPIEELKKFINEAVNPLRLQQHRDSALKVLGALCLRYESTPFKGRFIIEELIKRFAEVALSAHQSFRYTGPAINDYYQQTVLQRLKRACKVTIIEVWHRLENNTHTLDEPRAEPTTELEAIITLIDNLRELMQELIANNLDENKQDQLGKGTRFDYINITWTLWMACVCLQLEKQVAEYQHDNGDRNAGATVSYRFFATHSIDIIESQMRKINGTLSLLKSYVDVYRRYCEKEVVVDSGLVTFIINEDRLGGCISQCYRDYEKAIEKIQSERLNAGISMRASA